jgi:hypothetical protein
MNEGGLSICQSHAGWAFVDQHLGTVYRELLPRVRAACHSPSQTNLLDDADYFALVDEVMRHLNVMRDELPIAIDALDVAANKFETGSDTAPLFAACMKVGSYLHACAGLMDRLASTLAPPVYDAIFSSIRQIPAGFFIQLQGYFEVIAAAAEGRQVTAQTTVNINVQPLIDRATQLMQVQLNSVPAAAPLSTQGTVSAVWGCLTFVVLLLWVASCAW